MDSEDPQQLSHPMRVRMRLPAKNNVTQRNLTLLVN